MNAFLFIPSLFLLLSCNSSEYPSNKKMAEGNTVLVIQGDTIPKVVKSDEEWKDSRCDDCHTGVPVM